MNFLEQSLDRQNQFSKYLVVILGAYLGGQVIGAIPLGCIVAYKSIVSGGNIVLNPENMADFTVFGISKSWMLFLVMLPFAVSLIFIMLLINWLHKRSFAQTVNGTQKIRINRCLTGLAVWGILMAIYQLGDCWINPENYRLQFNLFAFIPLVLLSLIMIPIQTTFEELMLRGYLTQGVAGWTKSRWIAILIPGLTFGLLHSFNPEVKEFGFWATMPQYILSGVLFGLISVLDDGIELAMGMHAANNIFLSLFVTHSASALQTDAVLEQLHINPANETIMLIIVGMIVLAYFAWKYKWDFNILNQPVESLQQEEKYIQ